MICLGSLSLVAVVAGPAIAELGDEGPDVAEILIPFAEDNNPTCLDVMPDGENWDEAKFNGGNAQGNWESGGALGFELTFNDDNTFDFEGGPAVDAVVVKSGEGGHHFYWYSNDGDDDNSSTPFEALADDGLTSPQAISHISFCYDTDVYDLTVSKTVSDGTDNSSEGDEFDFTVDCGDHELDAADAAFTLGHTDTHTVSAIPETAECTVDEDNTGWSTTINGTADADGSAVVTMDSDQTLAFVNSRAGTSTTTTPTTVPPTTTTVPPTTTTVPVEVEPAQIGPFPNSPDPILQEVDEPEILPDTLVKTPPTVLGEVFTKAPAAAVLARTGTSSSALAAFAAILILLGIVMLVPFRRRELQA